MNRLFALTLIIGLAIVLASCRTASPPTATPSGPNQTKTVTIGTGGGSVKAGGGQEAYFAQGALTTGTSVKLQTYTTPPTTYANGVTSIAWRTVVSLSSAALAKDQGFFVVLPPLAGDTSVEHAVAEIGVKKMDGSTFNYVVAYDPTTADGRVVYVDASLVFGVLGSSVPQTLKITVQPVDVSKLATAAVQSSPSTQSLSLQGTTLKGLYRVLDTYAVNDVYNSCSDARHESIPPSSYSPVTSSADVPDDGRIPVILIHGWQVLGNYLSTNLLRTRIPSDAVFAPEVCAWESLTDAYYGAGGDTGFTDVRASFSLYTFGYDSSDSVADNTARLASAINADFPNTPVVLVGHSMGGLLANGYMHTPAGPSHVMHVITLGTPYRGSTALVCNKLNSDSTQCAHAIINSDLKGSALVAAAELALPTANPVTVAASVALAEGFLSHLQTIANLDADQGTRDLSWDAGATQTVSGTCAGGVPCLKTVSGTINPYLTNINSQVFQHYDQYTAFYGQIDKDHRSSSKLANLLALAQEAVPPKYPNDMIVPVPSGTLQLTGQTTITDTVQKLGFAHNDLGGKDPTNLYQEASTEGIHGALMKLASSTAPVSSVLYYADSFAGTDYMSQALVAYNVTTATSWSDFDQKLAGGGFGLAVALVQAAYSYPDLATLQAYVDGGGRLIFADWSEDASFDGLLQAAYSGDTNMSSLSLDSPLNQGVTNPVPLTNPGWSITFSMGLQAEAGATSMCAFPGTSDSCLVVGNSGRTVALGFLADTLPAADGAQIFTNILNLVAPATASAATTRAGPQRAQPGRLNHQLARPQCGGNLGVPCP